MQVPFDRPGGQEQLSADLRISAPVAGQPGDLLLLRREPLAGLSGALAHLLARGNQLPAGTLQANPNINSAALRPYKGYGVIRMSVNNGRSEYNALQLSADRRYKNGFKFGLAYTLSHSEDNASSKHHWVKVGDALGT